MKTKTNHGAVIPLMPVPAECYYYLKEGELIQEGDECYNWFREEWLPTGSAGMKRISGEYCRRIHNKVMEPIPELRFSDWVALLKVNGYGRVTGVYPMKKIILFTTVSEQEERVYIYDRITTETKQVH